MTDETRDVSKTTIRREWDWHTEDLRGGKYYCVTGTGCEDGIDIHEDDGGAEIAPLIAAAPDLFAALECVLSAHGEQLHDAFDQAHKAIAKARGETANAG